MGLLSDSCSKHLGGKVLLARPVVHRLSLTRCRLGATREGGSSLWQLRWPKANILEPGPKPQKANCPAHREKEEGTL